MEDVKGEVERLLGDGRLLGWIVETKLDSKRRVSGCAEQMKTKTHSNNMFPPIEFFHEAMKTGLALVGSSWLWP
jgi:hypothetical protein